VSSACLSVGPIKSSASAWRRPVGSPGACDARQGRRRQQVSDRLAGVDCGLPAAGLADWREWRRAESRSKGARFRRVLNDQKAHGISRAWRSGPIILLPIRVIAAEMCQHFASFSPLSCQHPPRRQRNRSQNTQHPAHSFIVCSCGTRVSIVSTDYYAVGRRVRSWRSCFDPVAQAVRHRQL
jgi:hypothetical protein